MNEELAKKLCTVRALISVHTTGGALDGRVTAFSFGAIFLDLRDPASMFSGSRCWVPLTAVTAFRVYDETGVITDGAYPVVTSDLEQYLNRET